MNNFYYYAKLNDNNICVEIVSRVSKLTNVTGYVEIPDYNETLRYRKWENNQWSISTYEPSIDATVQDKLIFLEDSNTVLAQQNLELRTLLTTLTTTVVETNTERIASAEAAINVLMGMQMTP